jgi:hypothetical protein
MHKSQGMTLDRVVIDMRSKFWEHGQLYVALISCKEAPHRIIRRVNEMGTAVKLKNSAKDSPTTHIQLKTRLLSQKTT